MLGAIPIWHLLSKLSHYIAENLDNTVLLIPPKPMCEFNLDGIKAVTVTLITSGRVTNTVKSLRSVATKNAVPRDDKRM
jgi:hypothetical protein